MYCGGTARVALALAAVAGAGARADDGGRPPMLPNADAWRRLPGAGPAPEPLPGWARMLAGPLPRTTAAMLELDAVHRTGATGLPAGLRGRVRLAAADANKSEPGRAAALADLRRAGEGTAPADAAERAAVAFARKLMLDANSVTDAEFKELVAAYGDKRVTGIVTLLAHAAFQDRVLLALLPPADGDAPPPTAAKFARTRTPAGPPPKPPAGGPKPVVPPAPAADPEWDGKTFADLQRGLAGQKDRAARVRVPDWAEVGPTLPADSWGHRLPRVLWNRVAYAHQPEATDAWFDAVDQFRQETRLDRVYSQYVFWVVTRAIDCFY